MKALESLLTPSLIEVLGWALIYSLWQGAVVALLLAGVLGVLPRQWASIRYWASCSALLLILVLPLSSSWMANSKLASGPPEQFARQPAATQSWPNPGFEKSHPKLVPQSNYPWRQVEQRIEPFLSWLILGWLIGVLFFAARLLNGWAYVQRLRLSNATSLTTRWQEQLQLLAAKIGVTAPVQLVESALVQVPAVIGRLRPIILLPACALTGLSKEQLEAVIIHELAHIRRYDYFVNLFQAIVETLLFYHPATWWVSRKIRIERENACDDLAVAVCGDRLLYARALTTLERLRNISVPELAMAADGGRLLDRIRRLLDPPAPPANKLAGPLAAAMVLASSVLFLMSPISSSMPRTVDELASTQLENFDAERTRQAGASDSVDRNFIETEDSFGAKSSPARAVEILRDSALPPNPDRSQKDPNSSVGQNPGGERSKSQSAAEGNTEDPTITSAREEQDRPVTVSGSDKSPEKPTDTLLIDLQSKDPAVRTRAKRELRRKMKEDALRGANDMVLETNRQVNKLSERLMREAIQRATQPAPAPKQKN